MELEVELGKLVEEQCKANDIYLLPIELPHILGMQALPFHHKDPFDRLLIAQARHENMVLLSSDDFFPDYPVRILW